LKQKKRKVEKLVKEFLDFSFGGHSGFDFNKKAFLQESTALMTMMISPSMFRKVTAFRPYYHLFDMFQDALYKPTQEY